MNEALVVCFRGIIGFFSLLIFTRALGKQQLGEISYFDYILGITLGAFAASLTVDLSTAAWPHWVGLLTWSTLGILMQSISLKSRKIAISINDEPIIVLHDGKVLAENLNKIKYTFAELIEELRLKDIFDFNEIKFAIIEANGQISVLKHEAFNNIISAMPISISNYNTNNDLIFSGMVIYDNLSKLDLNTDWLLNELKKQDVDSPSEVFYGFISSDNNLKLFSYKNNIICKKNIFK
jgi:uncharacterized membrane protein YcaP (DUF421 family)